MLNYQTCRNEEEWLAARAKHITSTESAALFGMSPYETAYEIAVKKQNPESFIDERNERMSWGQRLQDAIAQGIADDHRVVIESLQRAFGVHPNVPRMGASFDYAIIDTAEGETSEIGSLFKAHGPGILEIKNVDALVYRNWPENEAPDHIEIQVQHQLEVADREWAVLGVLVGGNRTEIYTRMRDRTVGAAIASRIAAFWQNLERGILPDPLLPQDARLIISLHQYADPNKVFDGQKDAVLADLCEEYVAARDVADAASDAKVSLQAKIFRHIGDAERALVHGFNLTAAMRAPTEVKAHTRAGYRGFRLTRAKN